MKTREAKITGYEAAALAGLASILAFLYLKLRKAIHMQAVDSPIRISDGELSTQDVTFPSKRGLSIRTQDEEFETDDDQNHFRCVFSEQFELKYIEVGNEQPVCVRTPADWKLTLFDCKGEKIVILKSPGCENVLNIRFPTTEGSLKGSSDAIEAVDLLPMEATVKVGSEKQRRFVRPNASQPWPIALIFNG